MNAGDESYKLAFPALWSNCHFSFKNRITPGDQDHFDAFVLGGGDVVAPSMLQMLSRITKPKYILSATASNHDINANLLATFDKIIVRDHPSVELVRAKGCEAQWLPDFSFALPVNKVNGLRLLDNLFKKYNTQKYDKVVVVVINACMIDTEYHEANSRKLVKFLALAEDLAEIVDTTAASFVFLPFCGSQPWDDRISNSYVASRCKFLHKNVIVYDEPDVQSTIDIIAAADAVISTRLHSTIFSCRAGTPFIDITHNHKNKWFLESVAKTDWSIAYDGFERKRCQNLLNTLLNNETDAREQVIKICEMQRNILKGGTMWVSFDNSKIITAMSQKPFSLPGQKVAEIDLPEGSNPHKLIGTKLQKLAPKPIKELKVAFICNWNDNCGISTYSGFLVRAMLPKVAQLKVFSEIPAQPPASPDENFVLRCWKRGESKKQLLQELKDFDPDFVILQHEFGIFPKATYFLQLMQGLEEYPYIVTMHSVYEHLDKAVCSSAIRNVVVHSQQGKDSLVRNGTNQQNVFIIPHGCLKFPDNTIKENWNIFQTPYALIQFGFGFFYKGVDRVLDAIHQLKITDPKFAEIFYCYLCSDNPHTSVVHNQYANFLNNKIKELDLSDNAVIIRKFQTEESINNYLRTAKLAVFPYVTDPKNVVYGASGAVRIAMANHIPVICSDAHMFDDLEGVLPRPHNAETLAKTIDEIFSNEDYRRTILQKQEQYINDNTWDISADRYLELYKII